MDGTAIISKLYDGRISVCIPWDQQTIDFFKTISVRRWCSETKEWSFAGENLEIIKNELSKKYKVVIREYRPVIHIFETEGSHAEIQAEYDPMVANLIEDIPNWQWDFKNKKWFIPNDHLDAFVDMLRSSHVAFTLSVKVEPPKQEPITKPKFNRNKCQK